MTAEHIPAEEKFRDAHVIEVDHQECCVSDNKGLICVGSMVMYVHEAREVRDWLNDVLPCTADPLLTKWADLQLRNVSTQSIEASAVLLEVIHQRDEAVRQARGIERSRS